MWSAIQGHDPESIDFKPNHHRIGFRNPGIFENAAIKIGRFFRLMVKPKAGVR
jgi:hypothetical protein